MGVVSVRKLDQIVDRNYLKARQKVFEEAKAVLEHEKIRKSIEGYLNQVLSKEMAVSIREALKSGSRNVRIVLPLTKVAQRLHGSYPSNLRQQLPVELVLLAMELLLVEQGHTVSLSEHQAVYEREVQVQAPPAASAQPTERVVEEEVPSQPPRSLGDVLDDTPMLPGSEGGDDGDDGGDGEDGDDENLDLSGLGG